MIAHEGAEGVERLALLPAALKEPKVQEAVIGEQGCSVSMVQSGKLKEYGKSGELTLAMVKLILSEEKPKERKITIKSDKIGEYFSDSYSNEEIENIIISLLDKWKEEGAV